MTAVLRHLPSLNIPGSQSLEPRLPPYHNKDHFACAQAFRDRLPPVAALQKSAKQLRCSGYSPNYWSYGTSYLVTLLFNGQLPKSFLQELCNNHGHQTKQSSGAHRAHVPRFKRDVELWEPKNYKQIQENGRRSEQKILEARWRQKKQFEQVSEKINSKKNKGDSVILKKDGMMDKGKKAYIERLQTTAPKRKLTKRTKPPKESSPPIHPADVIDTEEIFELTETGLESLEATSDDVLGDSRSSE